jgi:two-component system phosphate regulon sensor histidine kinase PhoR
VRVSLRARLIAGYLALVVLVGGGTLIVIERSLADALVGELDARLVGQAREVSRWLEVSGHPHRLAPRLARVVAARITIVAADGTVTGDSASAPDVGRPIGDAPEVAAARAGGLGRARRAIVDGGPAMYLVAVKTKDGGAVRVAVPLSNIAARRRIIRNRLLIASAIGLLVAGLLGFAAIRTVTTPLQRMTRTAERLARGDYEVPPPAPEAPRDELALLSRTLALLAGEIKARIGELTVERDLSGAVVDALVEGVVAVDASGAVRLANRAAASLLGEVTAPLPAALAPLVDEARGGVDRDLEIAINGRAVRVAARPLPGGGAVAVLYDVTQIRALDRVRREFLASATHELRTPVTAISGYAETLLAGDVDDASAKEFLATIHRNAARITRLVEDLLELEALEARPARIAARLPIPLAPIVSHAAATTRAAATAREQPEPSITVDVGDLAVLGDQAGVEHVVQNLVDNAVVHGGGAVTVTARASGKKIVLTVRDRGPGIPAEHLSRIFERFYRVDPGRSRARGGSGLGLAIVEQHVAAMGGTIEVASAPGEGTTFTITLDAA